MNWPRLNTILLSVMALVSTVTAFLLEGRYIEWAFILVMVLILARQEHMINKLNRFIVIDPDDEDED